VVRAVTFYNPVALQNITRPGISRFPGQRKAQDRRPVAQMRPSLLDVADGKPPNAAVVRRRVGEDPGAVVSAELGGSLAES